MSPLDLKAQAEFADVQTAGIPFAPYWVFSPKTMWRTFFEELGRPLW